MAVNGETCANKERGADLGLHTRFEGLGLGTNHGITDVALVFLFSLSINWLVSRAFDFFSIPTFVSSR